MADGTDTLRPGDTADEAYPLLATGADGKSTVIVNTDSEYSYVGRLVVEFDENGDIITDSIDREVSGADATTDDVVTDLYADPLDIDGDGDLDSDPFISGSRGDFVQDIADGVGAVIDAQDSNVFGQTDVYLEGRRGEVRTEETNLGNFSADANLWYAQKADSTVLVSIKNGGGIRDSIGRVEAVGDDVDELPPLANPEVGKEQGEVSELDISNALRFNNALTMLTLTPEQIKIVLEHAVAAVAPGATPGQFAQVGGIAFSFDAKAQGQVLNTTNGSVVTAGQRVQSAAIVDEDGNRIAIIKDGQVLDGAPEAIRAVTLTFLVSDPDGNGLGGDNYPFAKFIQENATFADRVDLSPDTSASDDVAARTGDAKFTDDGFEQDALAEYLAEFHSATPYGSADGGPATDERIQNLAAREDTVLPDGLPKVQDDKGTVAEDAGATFDLLANDSDPEGGDLTLAGFEVTAVAGVALSLANAREAFRVVDDQIVFDPGSRFQALNSGEAATVTLRYTASDGGDTTQGEFVLTVTGETDYVELSGTNRSETFVGTAGNDLIDVRNGDDTVRAAGGFDLVNGGNGRDAIFGGAGNDLLNGQEGNDRIVGDEGADVIAGGGGDDDLSGGAGADVFRFVPGDGKDTVSGFEAGQGAGDVIELVLSEFSDFANLFATGLRDTSRGAELRYSDGSRMTLLGVDADDPRANDFLFV